jgi:hypothetical protein
VKIKKVSHMKRPEPPELDDPEWTDFQPVLDAESNVERFRAARERARQRIAHGSPGKPPGPAR